MKPSELLEKNYPPSILIYGGPGGGKTALVSQLFNAYLFDFDKGMRTAATLKDKFFDQRAKIEFDEYFDEDAKKPKVFRLAMQKLLEITRDKLAGKWAHDAVVVDSLTGLCRALELQVCFDKHQDSMAPLQIETQDYRRLISELNRFLTLIRALRIPTILTAHIDFLDTPIKGKFGEREIIEMFPSSGTKKHGRSIQWLFDECWYADKRDIGQNKQEYRVNGNKSGIYKTRTRSSFSLTRHDEIGLIELLKKIGYNYEHRNRVNTQSS